MFSSCTWILEDTYFIKQIRPRYWQDPYTVTIRLKFFISDVDVKTNFAFICFCVFVQTNYIIHKFNFKMDLRYWQVKFTVPIRFDVVQYFDNYLDDKF